MKYLIQIFIILITQHIYANTYYAIGLQSNLGNYKYNISDENTIYNGHDVSYLIGIKADYLDIIYNFGNQNDSINSKEIKKIDINIKNILLSDYMALKYGIGMTYDISIVKTKNEIYYYHNDVLIHPLIEVSISNEKWNTGVMFKIDKKLIEIANLNDKKSTYEYDSQINYNLFLGYSFR